MDEQAAQNIIDFATAQAELPDKEDELATEAGHWYLPDGSPFYTVPRRSGKLKGQPRGVSLRWDRKLMMELGVAPSTTSITGIIEKPGLNLYHERNVFNATLDWVRAASDEDVAKVIDSEDERKKIFPHVRYESKSHSRNAAERGAALHGEIERFLKGDLVKDQNWLPHLIKITAALSQYGINIRDGAPEKSFWHSSGYGGKTDWHSRKTNFLLDFKTKPSKEKFNTNSGNIMQLASYREGLIMPSARCANVMVGCEDCEVRIIEWSDSELRKGWEKFLLLLKFWKSEHNYYPRKPKT